MSEVLTKEFNIFMSGVGGQGIGLLSEVLLRAIAYSGQKVVAVDTHGLAQRGGMVVSYLRMGSSVHSPLINKHAADLLLSLERHEAYRAVLDYAKPGAHLLFYDSCWQPLSVRLGRIKELTVVELQERCQKVGVHCTPVFEPSLPDVRMQNIALIKQVITLGLIPGVTREHVLRAMTDLIADVHLEKNIALISE